MTEQEVNKFVAALTAAGRRHFFAIERALTERDRDLRWYHRVGQHALALRDEADRPYWMHIIGDALQISHNMITKPLVFAQQFTAPSDLQELDRLKVTWSSVVATMSLRDRKAQLAILCEAFDRPEPWSGARLQLEVRQRLGERRQPRTGRKVLPPTVDAPAIEVEELLTRLRTLEHYLDIRWVSRETGLLSNLQGTSRQKSVTSLKNLLAQAEEALGRLAKQIEQLRRGFRAACSNT